MVKTSKFKIKIFDKEYDADFVSDDFPFQLKFKFKTENLNFLDKDYESSIPVEINDEIYLCYISSYYAISIHQIEIEMKFLLIKNYEKIRYLFQ